MNDTPIDADGLLVVICTYNEIADLPRLVENLRSCLAGVHILIVDDDSPDGTGCWGMEQAEKCDDLFCIVRLADKGLGSSAMKGLGWGLERHYRWLATMDADFSHDPACMPDLLRALESSNGAGMVVGSRYVSKGTISGWPWHRRMASRWLNRATRVILRIPVLDCTGAMRIYCADTLERAGVLQVRSRGYGYLEELLYRVHRAGVKIVEVPIHFQDRKSGKSKASWRHGLAALGRIVMIRLGR